MINLYVKTHNQTGLQYFGKTIKDPYIYKGSGTRWLRHLRKHGNDVSTKVWSFETINEANEFALKFSVDNNIVEDSNWANLRIEDAKDGNLGGIYNFFYGKQHTNETKEYLSLIKKGVNVGPANPFFGKHHTNETKQHLSTLAKNRVLSEEKKQQCRTAAIGSKRTDVHKKKYSDYASSRYWIVNKEGDVRHTNSLSDERLLNGSYIRGKIWKN